MKFHFIRTSWEGKFPYLIGLRRPTYVAFACSIVSCATCHGSRFDISTGAVINGPATKALNVYEVQEIEGGIRSTIASRSQNVRLWPIADISSCSGHVCFRGGH